MRKAFRFNLNSTKTSRVNVRKRVYSDFAFENFRYKEKRRSLVSTKNAVKWVLASPSAEGYHDDCVTLFVLATRQLKRIPPPGVGVMFGEDPKLLWKKGNIYNHPFFRQFSMG